MLKVKFRNVTIGVILVFIIASLFISNPNLFSTSDGFTQNSSNNQIKSSNKSSNVTLYSSINTNSKEISTNIMPTGTYSFFDEPELDIGTFLHDRTYVGVSELQYPSSLSTGKAHDELNETFFADGYTSLNSSTLPEYEISAPRESILSIAVDYNMTKSFGVWTGGISGRVGTNYDGQGISDMCWDGTYWNVVQSWHPDISRSVYVYDVNWNFVAIYTVLGAGSSIGSIGSNRTHNIIMDNGGNMRLYDTDWNFIRTKPSSGGYGGVASNGTHWFVMNQYGTVYMYDKQLDYTGKSWVNIDEGVGENPNSLTYKDDKFYVAGWDRVGNDHRNVAVFDMDFNLEHVYPTDDDGKFWYSKPTGIDYCDDDDSWWILDTWSTERRAYQYNRFPDYTLMDYVNITDFTYTKLGTPYYENYTVDLDTTLSRLDTDMDGNGSMVFTFDSSYFEEYGGANDIIVNEQILNLSTDYGGFLINYSIYINYSSNSWKVPSEVDLKINGESVVDETYNSGQVILLSYPSTLNITADIPVYFKLDIVVNFTFTFDLDELENNYLKKDFILLSNHSIKITKIEISSISNIAKIYLNNLDLENSNPNTLTTPVLVEQFELSKLEVLLNQVPLGWVFYCETGEQIQNALISIGGAQGTLIIIRSIILSKTINLTFGGTYTIFRQGNFEVLSMKLNKTMFNITDVSDLNLNNIVFNASESILNKPLIYINEAQNNPVNIDNITILGSNQRGTGILIESNGVVVKNCLINGTETGIHSINSQGSQIYYNTISENNIGVKLDSNSQSNILYKNYFLQNNLHAQDNGIGNNWDNSYIGNYWDNYTDLGPEAIDLDNDGIGDINYTVSGSVKANDSLPIFGNPFHDGSKIYIYGSLETGINSWQYMSTRAWCNGLGTQDDPFIIKGLTIDGEGGSGDSSIWIEDSSTIYFLIEGSTLFNSKGGDNYAGIKLDNVEYGILRNNKIVSNLGHGIYLRDSNYIDILGNTIKSNLYDGIVFKGSIGNRFINISNNNIQNNINNGVLLTNVPQGPVYIINNNITDNNKKGILLINAQSCEIYKNKIENNDDEGVFLTEPLSDYNEIIGNRFSGNLLSIVDWSGSNNKIGWNAIEGKVESIIIDNNNGGDFTWQQALQKLAWVSGTPSNPLYFENIHVLSNDGWSALTIVDSNVQFEIRGCTFSNASKEAGIKLLRTENGNVSYSVSDNNMYGILLDHSNYTAVRDSQFIGNIEGIEEIDCRDNIFENNIVINKDQIDPIPGDSDDTDGDSSEESNISNFIFFISIVTVFICIIGAIGYGLHKKYGSKGIKTKKVDIKFAEDLGIVPQSSIEDDSIPQSLYEGLTGYDNMIESEIDLEKDDKE